MNRGIQSTESKTQISFLPWIGTLYLWCKFVFVNLFGSNCRIPGHSFTCHWIRIASIVLCLDLQSLPTHVSEVDQSGWVFCNLAFVCLLSCISIQTDLGWRIKLFSLKLNDILRKEPKLLRAVIKARSFLNWATFLVSSLLNQIKERNFTEKVLLVFLKASRQTFETIFVMSICHDLTAVNYRAKKNYHLKKVSVASN